MVLASSALALLLAEAALRVAPAGTRLAVESAPPEIEPLSLANGYRPPSVWLYTADPDPSIVYRLPAHLATTHKGKPVTTNGNGFRGPELRSGTWRVVGIGDSTMFGWGVAEQSCYMRRVERLLARRFPDVETVNLGVPGYNTVQEVALLERNLDLLAPRYVVVGFNDNDISVPLPQLGRPPLLERCSYLYRLVRLRLRGTFPARTWEQRIHAAFRHLGGLARKHGFRVIVFINADNVDARTDPALLPQPALRGLCLGLGFTVVDFHATLVRAVRAGRISTSYELWLSRSGRIDPHPNELGHDLIATDVARAIEALEKSRS